MWTERSVDFGKYWRNRPLVFSFVPRGQGLAASQKYTRNAGLCSDLEVTGHLGALIPGETPSRSGGQLVERSDDGGVDRDRVLHGQVQQLGVAGLSLDQSADPGGVVRADDQVAFQWLGGCGLLVRSRGRGR